MSEHKPRGGRDRFPKRVPMFWSNFSVYESDLDGMAEAARLREGKEVIRTQEPIPNRYVYVRPPMPYDKFLDERRRREAKPR